jgi:hypothetical protein
MMDSLKRCCQQKEKPLVRTFSSSHLPQLPHMEQRRQILLKTAIQHQHQQHQNTEEQSWSATQFLDRLFFGN